MADGLPETRTSAAAVEARRLLARYLDPSKRWSGANDRRLRALCRDDADAAALYNRAVTRQRALAGGDPSVPSGLELRRLAAASADLATPPTTRRWLAWLAPVVVVAAALFIVPRLAPTDPDEYLGARGLPASDLPDRRAGLGVGAVTADGDEYEAIFSPAHLEDWLRISYTNERPECAFLFVFGVQPERAASEQITWIAPTPEEVRSLPITIARFHQLPFEVRLAARHVAGAVRFVALFTSQPITTAQVEAAWLGLASSTRDALPSELESRLRERLQLSPRDVVQVLETRILPGSAADDVPAHPGEEATP